MAYLTRQDYNTIIDDEITDIVIESNDNIRLRAEAMAISEVKGYISGVYDTSFFDSINVVSEMDSDDAIEGDYLQIVKENDTLYYKVLENADLVTLDLTDDNQFKKVKNPRSELIVMITIDCAAYHYHSRQAPNQIPQVRIDRYTEAFAKLKDIRKGQIQLELTKVGLSNDETPKPTTGSISVTSRKRPSMNW